MANPYVPGAGTEPYRLPGRADAQIWWRRCLTDLEGTGYTSKRGRVFTGIRGVGKTSLLRHFERSAVERGFGGVLVQAGGSDPLRAYLTDELTRLVEDESSFVEKHGRLTELGARVGPVELTGRREFTASETTSPAESAFLRLVDDVARAHAAIGTGLVILVDEAQDSDVPSLTSLCRVVHLLRGPALQLVLAGLPALEDVIDQAITHSDRLLEYRVLDNLDPEATREALLEPAMAQGVRWTDGAVEQVVELSDGYPSFVQEYAYAIWEAKGEAAVIDADVVKAGVPQAAANIDRQFRSVWRGSTPAGRDYMAALAGLGGEARTADVAGELGRRPHELTMTLRMLKERGALRSPRRGLITFCRPGMEDWVVEAGD